jgi:hypothetical protein
MRTTASDTSTCATTHHPAYACATEGRHTEMRNTTKGLRPGTKIRVKGKGKRGHGAITAVADDHIEYRSDYSGGVYYARISDVACVRPRIYKGDATWS